LVNRLHLIISVSKFGVAVGGLARVILESSFFCLPSPCILYAFFNRILDLDINVAHYSHKFKLQERPATRTWFRRQAKVRAK
jgi:hypothetical protein